MYCVVVIKLLIYSLFLQNKYSLANKTNKYRFLRG